VLQAVRKADSRLLLRGITNVEDDINATLCQERLFARLLTGFGGLALTLAAVGLYGVVAYAIRARTREIGAQIALGATRRRVQWMVLRDTLGISAVGVAIGLPGALLGSRFLADLLYGLTPSDPVTIGTVAVMMLVVAALAGVLPARRAASVDPNVALRSE